MNEFIEQFLIEGRELVAQGSDDLLALEERPSDRERLDSAFRAFHTLKGAAGIVDFVAMANILHAGEDVLSAVRTGAVTMTPAVTDLCLSCLDQVTAWLDAMQATGEVPADAQARADEVVRQFQLVTDAASATSGEARSDSPSRSVESGRAMPDAALHLLEEQVRLLRDGSSEARAARWQSAVHVASNVLRALGHSAEAGNLQRLADRATAAATPGSLADALAEIVEDLTVAMPAQGGLSPSPAETSVRVDVARIDRLVKLAGELTVAKNAVGHLARLAVEEADPRRLATELKTQHLRLERLVTELQQSVVGLRVLPLQAAFQRFPRLVREIAGALGKPARLMIEGATTEADKSIVAAIFEPLLHVIRNSLDHGVEKPEERRSLGKSETATIRLRAARSGEHIVVEVEDDGRGLDLARIRAVAIERDVLPRSVIEAMNEAELTDLIFSPGFSTAATVNDLSGRGVGMDVVRTAVEALGGRIAVSSQPGVGTQVRFTLPFTVMMTRVMTVEVAGQMFGLPLDAVMETVRLPRSAIAPVGAAMAFVLRDRTVPLIDLARALGSSVSQRTGDAVIVIVRAGADMGGLEVDRLGERLDVMLTAPEGLLADVPGIDGTTLMGDGRVLLVLDLVQLLR